MDKRKNIVLRKISEWCYNDTKREYYNSDKFNYVNKAVFMADFSLLDRSYKPFVEYIKTGMTNPKSFEHVKNNILFWFKNKRSIYVC